jgi:hypothetical protein
MSKPARRHLNPKKLLLSKWTATSPLGQEKHFIVSRIIEPEQPNLQIEMVRKPFIPDVVWCCAGVSLSISDCGNRVGINFAV